jgi:hypothetical protein
MESGNIFISLLEKKTLYHYQIQGKNADAVNFSFKELIE